MRLLPLVLSAHASGFRPMVDALEPWDGGGSRSCRFCGLSAASWQERFHLNGDHGDERAENVISACALCHLTQHLERLTIDEEAIVIWLPEMTQGALNACVRGVHRVLVAHGASLNMKGRPKSDHPSLYAAISAYAGLRERSGAARERFGGTSPHALGEALLNMSAEAYARRGMLLGGARLLSLGRLYRDGEDIYPALIKQLNEESQTASGEAIGETVKKGKRL